MLFAVWCLAVVVFGRLVLACNRLGRGVLPLLRLTDHAGAARTDAADATGARAAHRTAGTASLGALHGLLHQGAEHAGLPAEGLHG